MCDVPRAVACCFARHSRSSRALFRVSSACCVARVRASFSRYRGSFPRVTVDALSILYCLLLWHFILYGVMFLCVYICLFVCSCLYSLCVANRLRSNSELRGIDDQASATKWPCSSSSTRLKTLSIHLVKASVL
jgi:hypothetical protein